MGRNRNIYDPLEATAERRWYVVNNIHGALLEVRELAPGLDLKREFIQALIRCLDAGWSIAEFDSRTGVFFAQKGVERRQFEITPADDGRDRGVGTGMTNAPQGGTSRLGGLAARMQFFQVLLSLRNVALGLLCTLARRTAC